MNPNNTIFNNELENFNQSESCNDCLMTDCENIKTVNSIGLTNTQVTNFINFPFVFPKSRLEVKENKFHDIKRNTLGKLMDRMQKNREDRMEKILYGKQAIIDNLKNEIYDVINS